MLKREWGAESNGEATAPIKSLVKLQPWFQSLRWKTCLRQNCSLGFSACSEGPAFGQNIDDDGDIHKCPNRHRHQSVLPRGRSFSANSGTKARVLSQVRSSTANSRTKAAVLLELNRCGSFPFLYAPHSLFST